MTQKQAILTSIVVIAVAAVLYYLYRQSQSNTSNTSTDASRFGGSVTSFNTVQPSTGTIIVPVQPVYPTPSRPHITTEVINIENGGGIRARLYRSNTRLIDAELSIPNGLIPDNQTNANYYAVAGCYLKNLFSSNPNVDFNRGNRAYQRLVSELNNHNFRINLTTCTAEEQVVPVEPVTPVEPIPTPTPLPDPTPTPIPTPTPNPVTPPTIQPVADASARFVNNRLNIRRR